MTLRQIAALTLALAPAALPSAAFAKNIVIANDDGLTSNVTALYRALKAEGHDVIVSVPCTGQSGMGAAILFSRPLTALTADCLNGAAKAGDPGAGPMTKAGFENDFFYVNGTPVMATLYGIDVAAKQRWGKAPDLVLSGPNEGQNVGYIVITSGTVNNAQYATIRGIPAVALSAGSNTTDNKELANPRSAVVAKLSAEFVGALFARAGNAPVLPAGIALNVNFPDKLEGARWKAARIGTYNAFSVAFTDNMARSASPEMAAAARAHGAALPPMPGLTVLLNNAKPTAAQKDDESVVYQKDIAVSPMQIGYEPAPATHGWLRRHLKGFLARGSPAGLPSVALVTMGARFTTRIQATGLAQRAARAGWTCP